MYIVIAKLRQLRRTRQNARGSRCLGAEQLPGQVRREPQHRSAKHRTLVRYKVLYVTSCNQLCVTFIIYIHYQLQLILATCS